MVNAEALKNAGIDYAQGVKRCANMGLADISAAAGAVIELLRSDSYTEAALTAAFLKFKTVYTAASKGIEAAMGE